MAFDAAPTATATATATAYVDRTARLSALQSDIRRALRDAEHAEPSLEEAKALSEWIAQNSWSVRGLLDSCRYGVPCTNPSYGLLSLYVACLDDLADPARLLGTLAFRRDSADRMADGFLAMAAEKEARAAWPTRSHADAEHDRAGAAVCRGLALTDRRRARDLEAAIVRRTALAEAA